MRRYLVSVVDRDQEVERATSADRALASTDSSALPTTARGRWLVLAILALALVLRVGAVLENRSSYAPMNDSKDFDNIAVSMAHGHGYGPYALPPATPDSPGAFRSPAYPAALAAVYVVVGDHKWTAGRLENALFGVIDVALIGLIAAQLWDRRVGAVALAIAAVHPTLILIGSGLVLEPLLVACSLGALAAALQHRRAPRGWRWPLLAGVLLGLAILTREVGFALVLPIAWLLLPSHVRGRARLSRRAVAAPLLFLVVAALVVLPWTVRNAVEFHAFEPVSSSAGFGLAGTYNATSATQRGEWTRPYDDPRLRDVLLALGKTDEAKVDKAMRTEALDYMKAHPAYIGEVAVWGSIRLFDLDGGAYDRHIAPFVPYANKLMWLSILATYPILVLAAIGAFRPGARRAPFALWAIPILVFVEIIFLLPANVRYRSSIEPYLVLLAALAITPYVDRVLARRSTRTAAPRPDPSRSA